MALNNLTEWLSTKAVLPTSHKTSHTVFGGAAEELNTASLGSSQAPVRTGAGLLDYIRFSDEFQNNVS